MLSFLSLKFKENSQNYQKKKRKCWSYYFTKKKSLSENESRGGGGAALAAHNSSSHIYYSDSNDESSHLPLTVEQERQKREEIARQREERLKLRLLKRESFPVDQTLQQSLNGHDETSQTSNVSASGGGGQNGSKNAAADFNYKNFFLMNKVLAKILQSKYAWPFKEPVSEEDAPDYNQIIEHPMDLNTIQLRINKKVYKSRAEFQDDLELIVSNCLKYNGDESFYGKLALKFDDFYRRWLGIFYPREISTSLEEKNRQLMKLINRDEDSSMFNENNENNHSSMFNENSGDPDYNESSAAQQQPGGGAGYETRLLSDFSNNNDMLLNGSSMRKPHHQRRKHGIDSKVAAYLQEPQFVTKRTSSGRLVKMKISTDYDYTSDQEKEARKKKSMK